MQMKKPSRPGDMVGALIEELGITVTDAASALGVTRQTLSNLINKPNVSVSPEMALRLEAILGSSAGNWLRMQANYDEMLVRGRSEEILQKVKQGRVQQVRAAELEVS